MKRNIEKVTISCSQCKAIFTRQKEHEAERPLLFCAYCSAPLKEPLKLDARATTQLAEHTPQQKEIHKTLDRYQILTSIGKGGMGEVFLAYDPVCGRKIALKQIRNDLLTHPQLQRRFLREAEITSQLTHPAIIPIYSIHKAPTHTYYTMPYLEGETLRQLLRKAKIQLKHHKHALDSHTSIPALMRIFLQVCQATAYAHSKGVLHRDLKPENVIVGTYGQVIILDWGLATLVNEEDDEALPEVSNTQARNITRIGKVVGTITYMAPERALGSKATVQTDIYSLGVMLYQILTLTTPFQRKNLKEFKKTWMKEQLATPESIAPHREVPQILSEVVKRCLIQDPQLRYQTVDDLIKSIENYLEGRSEWFLVKKLDIHKPSDWQFHENILISEHTAITRSQDVSEWVSVMVAKDPFPDNTRIEATVRLGPTGHGIGFFFSIPSPIDKHQLTEGYCLWLSSEHEKIKKTKLVRSSVSLLLAQDIWIKANEHVRIRIEKIDLHIYVYINDIMQFSYMSHIPILGTYVGIMARDDDFEIKNFDISIGSQNVQISCLAIPDAFLANRDFERALNEYRKIATLFPGRAEGSEALFRAGITLLEQAKASSTSDAMQSLCTDAHTEFEKLRNTPGAPLEYLGKALIYQYMKEYDEEIKCFELAIRKYPHHPHLLVLEEQIALRLHESARQNRYVAYQFILLVMRHLKHLIEMPSIHRIVCSLERHWERPYFILHEKSADSDLNRLTFCLVIAFWLAKPHAIHETLRELLQKPILPVPEILDAIYLLIELGAYTIAQDEMRFIRELLSKQEIKKFTAGFQLFEYMVATASFAFDEVEPFIKNADDSLQDIRCLLFILKRAQIANKQEIATDVITRLLQMHHTDRQQIIDAAIVEASLHFDLEGISKSVLHRYNEQELMSETHLLYFLNSCWLCKNKGAHVAMQFFSELLDTSYPESRLLAAHMLAEHINIHNARWEKQSFLFEKRLMYQQLRLFYKQIGDEEAAQTYALLEQQQYYI